MTDLTAEETPARRNGAAAPAQTAFSLPLGAAIALASLAGALLTLPRAQSVWRTGAFFDSDDAMRAVELRDFLAGQPWFDLTAARVDPPHGLVMHWSRFVDAPLAALQSAFGLLLAPDMAERATRLAFPFLLLAALMALVAWCASILGAKTARGPAVFLTLLSGAAFVQFAPGRIDHHAPQVVLLAAAFGFFLRGLDPARAPAMAASAALMAVSIAVSLENLPFFAVLIGALPALLLVDGVAARGRLGWFTGGALLAFPAGYAGAIAPSRYALSACDAFSAPHLAAILTGALALGLLALAAPWLESFRKRTAAAGFATVAVLTAVLLTAPSCLGDPLGGLDPLLREVWLTNVAEAKPLLVFMEKSPGVVIATAAPVALALGVSLIGAWSASGIARRRWLVAGAVIAIGLAGGLLHVRVFSSVTPLAMAALAAAVAGLAGRFAAVLRPFARASLAGALCLAVSPMGLALALPSPETGDTQGADLTCLKPEVLAPLAALAPARVAGPVDMGAHVLAHTPHSVFAAPYHRNNRGNRVAVDAFLAAPGEAETILRGAGAELVVWCAGEKKRNVLAKRAPNGLAAMLARGEAPAWLERTGPAGGPLHIYAVKPGG
jgi:hypothetical protein